MNIIKLYPNTNDSEIELINKYYIIINTLFNNILYQSEFDIISNSITSAFITDFNTKFPNILTIGNSIQLFKIPIIKVSNAQYIFDKIFDIYDENINNCLISNALFQYDEYFYYKYNWNKVYSNSINIDKISVSAKLGNISALYTISNFISIYISNIEDIDSEDVKKCQNILYFIDSNIEEYIKKYILYYPISIILGIDQNISYQHLRLKTLALSDVGICKDNIDYNIDFRILIEFKVYLNSKDLEILYNNGYLYLKLFNLYYSGINNNTDNILIILNMIILCINGLNSSVYCIINKYTHFINNRNDDEIYEINNNVIIMNKLLEISNFDKNIFPNNKIEYLNIKYLLTLDKYYGEKIFEHINLNKILELSELKTDNVTIIQLLNYKNIEYIKTEINYYNLDEASKKILYNGNYFWDKVEEIYSKNEDQNDVIEFVNILYGIYTKCSKNKFFKLKPFDPISNILIEYENIQDDGNGSCYDNSTILNTIIEDETVRNATLDVFEGIISDKTLSDDEKEQQIKKLSKIVATKYISNIDKLVLYTTVYMLGVVLLDLYNMYKI